MREILFRGKEVESSDWYYGDIFHSSMNVDTTRIHDYINRANVEIIPDTLGQFTGLTDKNGVKVFEGDIVRCVSRLDYANMIVVFEDGEFRMVKCEDYKTYTTGNGYFSVRCFHKEVIGNIYDNPELIGGERNEP